jgi:leucyl aminopeptidase (aminopeptidase T)
VIITDRARRHIADALAAEAGGAGATVKIFVMEDFVARPAREYPADLARQITEFEPTVSLFAATGQEGELAFRMPMRQQVCETLRCRHGHMIGIDDRLMEEGMTADYREIAKLTHRVNDAVSGARRVEVKAPSGTDLVATLDPRKLRWHPCPGLYLEQGMWGNLPEGETFTCPAAVDGVIGAEVLGDYLSERYGVLARPARLEIEGGRVRKIDAGDPAIQADLESYLSTHPNSNRAGEFAIGTNIALRGLTGNLLQDEKLPGVHIAFGDPYGAETGADWSCPTHIDFVATRSSIVVDGQALMRDGKFLI